MLIAARIQGDLVAEEAEQEKRQISFVADFFKKKEFGALRKLNFLNSNLNQDYTLHQCLNVSELEIYNTLIAQILRRRSGASTGH